MLNPLFFLILRLNNACSPLIFNLQINYPIRIKDIPFKSFQLWSFEVQTRPQSKLLQKTQNTNCNSAWINDCCLQNSFKNVHRISGWLSWSFFSFKKAKVRNAKIFSRNAKENFVKTMSFIAVTINSSK